MNVLIIDIGTSSMRGVVFDERGSVEAVKQITYRPTCNTDGELEQRAEAFRSCLVEIIKELVESGECGAIEALAITGQRSTVVPVGADGAALMPMIMWQDVRNRDLCQRLSEQNDLIARKSGAKINTIFFGGKLSWVREERPEIYRKTAQFVTIPEYLIHEMTGVYCMDHTYGSRSNLMDLAACQWDDELLKLFGVKREHLSELVPPGSVCGAVTDAFSKETGLTAGIPVISAGGDQQCAAVGQGAYKSGVLSVVCGTGAFMVTTLDSLPEERNPDLIYNCAGVSGKYIVEANVMTCCAAYDWFHRTFYDWPDGKPDYHKINEELVRTGTEPAAMLTLPFFQGRSTPDWNPAATAVMSGITLNTSRGEILKSILEGIFGEIRLNIELFEQSTAIDYACISGGLTKSSYVNQLQADLYGFPLKRLKDTESTARGALMTALKTLGVYGSLDEAYQRLTERIPLEEYLPDPERGAKYKDKLQEAGILYNRIYQRKL